MITWFNAPNEGLSPGGQLTLKTLTATENKTYSEEGTAYTSVTVNVEGGGGSSDFSTAEVTVVASSMYFYDNCPCAVDSEEINACFGMAQPTGPTTIYTVPLYKGKCVWAPSDGVENVTVSGDATLTETSILITGDCTITLS